MKSLPLVLVAIPKGSQSQLLPHLKSMEVEVVAVETCWQVRDLVATHPVDLVITDMTLPDGNWCDILKHLVDNNTRASVVVAATTATDSLWAEVFWRGAYDLLIEPYQGHEVRHVVWSALRATMRSKEQTEVSSEGAA